MTRILFVCYGNICRSPMAEFCMKDLAARAGRVNDFLIESAATSPCNTGSGVYSDARRMLEQHGIGCEGKRARPMTPADYERFDLLIGMDRVNLRDMKHICGGDPDRKIRLLLDSWEVDDPWYTGDYETAWRDISRGCRKLFDALS